MASSLILTNDSVKPVLIPQIDSLVRTKSLDAGLSSIEQLGTLRFRLPEEAAVTPESWKP